MSAKDEANKIPDSDDVARRAQYHNEHPIVSRLVILRVKMNHAFGAHRFIAFDNELAAIEQDISALIAHEPAAREIRRLERIIELERHALNNRPLCPDCRDKTKATDECLRCRYQRAEDRLAALADTKE